MNFNPESSLFIFAANALPRARYDERNRPCLLRVLTRVVISTFYCLKWPQNKAVQDGLVR